MGWDKKPSDFMITVKKDANKHLRKVTLVLTANLVQSTPVDTGRARSNWIVSVGTPSEEVLYLEAKGKRSVDGGSGSTSIQSAKDVKAEFGKLIFISNNLSYIGFLNNGTPTMAPFNMVEKSIKSTVAQLG